MYVSHSRLRRDVERWQAKGWIDDDGARQIKAELDSRVVGFSLPNTLAVLAAVLMALAVLSFVAANWQDMPKLVRLLTLGSALAASYAGANALFERGLDGFAHAAVLLGVAIFGASIMLIAQMYHMEGNPPDAVWLWSMGGLAAGILLRSNPALGLAIVLITYWSYMGLEYSQRGVHWGFLQMWAIAAFGVAQTRWRRGLQLLALSITAWFLISAFQLWDANAKYVIMIVGLALAGISIYAGEAIDRWRHISPTLLSYGMVLAYMGLFIIQFVPTTFGSGAADTTNLWFWAIFTLGLIIAALIWAWRTENRSAMWLAYVFFSIEIFAIYVQKIGTMLGTSAFFFITALMVAALAAAAYRMHNATTKQPGVRS